MKLKEFELDGHPHIALLLSRKETSKLCASLAYQLGHDDGIIPIQEYLCKVKQINGEEKKVYFTGILKEDEY